MFCTSAFNTSTIQQRHLHFLWLAVWFIPCLRELDIMGQASTMHGDVGLSYFEVIIFEECTI